MKKEMHVLFHKLWTKAVGTPDYVKDEWQQLERLIEESKFRDPLCVRGHVPDCDCG